MSKTPYEIRLELLKLAKDIVYEPIYSKRSALEQEWHSQREQNPSASFPTLPDFPSATDVIVKAEELKKFVDAA